MSRYDFTTPRLFVDAPIRRGTPLALDRGQTNYLRNVLRLPDGSSVLIFNGLDGEWRAELGGSSKAGSLQALEQSRPQPARSDLIYGFAVLKHARLDYMVQKAVEMGVGVLQPLLTQHGQVGRVNAERMRANAIEAAEQCGILAVPEVREPLRLDAFLISWPDDARLVFCDEDAPVADPVAALRAAPSGTGPIGLLIGPEGGFDAKERAAILAKPNAIRLSLGSRILRADTAAVAALAVIQAVIGDWRDASV